MALELIDTLYLFNNMTKRTFITTIIVFIYTSSINAQVLKTSFSAPRDSYMFNAVKLWLEELSELSGMEFQLLNIPISRSESELLSGNIDADIGRTIYVYGNDDRVIYVKYPIYQMQYHIFTKNISSDDVDKLMKYKIVINRGNRLMEHWVKENNITNVINTKDAYTAFLLIALDRADYFLGPATYVSYIEDNISFREIKRLDPPLMLIPIYLVINSKHKSLEPAISTAIKKMAETGRTEDILAAKY